MRTIWLITAGFTDLQLPAWKVSDNGGDFTAVRIDIRPANGKLRELHEGIIQLLRNGQVYFPSNLPPPARNLEAKIELEFLPPPRDFLASISTNDKILGLAPGKDAISSAESDRFPILCPKITPLTKSKVIQDIEHGDLTVLVLQTNRDPELNRQEPVAVGPVLSKYIADSLGLAWLDSWGNVEADLPLAGKATWLDILKADENLETASVWESIRARLHAAFDAIDSGCNEGSQIIVSTGGGLPDLKGAIEKLCASRFGDHRLKLLTAPERGPQRVESMLLSRRPGELEALRFQCCEALRQGDYLGAYGLASRCRNIRSASAWADDVIWSLGPMLELDLSSGPRIGSTALLRWQVLAVQIEAALCRADEAAGLRALHRFLECCFWLFLSGSEKIRAAGVVVDPDRQLLLGDLRVLNWGADLLGEMNTMVLENRPTRVQIIANWLASSGQPRDPDAADAFRALYEKYRERPKYNSFSLNEIRNMLSHSNSQGLSGTALRSQVLALIGRNGYSSQFGENFLSHSRVQTLLRGLGDGNEATLSAVVAQQLALLLGRVWRG